MSESQKTDDPLNGFKGLRWKAPTGVWLYIMLDADGTIRWEPAEPPAKGSWLPRFLRRRNGSQ